MSNVTELRNNNAEIEEQMRRRECDEALAELLAEQTEEWVKQYEEYEFLQTLEEQHDEMLAYEATYRDNQ